MKWQYLLSIFTGAIDRRQRDAPEGIMPNVSKTLAQTISKHFCWLNGLNVGT